MTLRLLFVPVAVALLVLAFACGKTSGNCDITNCAGCCDSERECQPGFVPESCGVGGLACSTCAPGASCVVGGCVVRADAGEDAGKGGSNDAGEDAGFGSNDAGEDAGITMSDAGEDAGFNFNDAGEDAGLGAGDAGEDTGNG